MAVGVASSIRDITSTITTGLKDEIDRVIADNAVVVFSKTSCQFCFELKRVLGSYGVPYAVIEVDRAAASSAVYKTLFEITKVDTVPQLFIAGSFIGGCDDTKARLHGGDYAFLAP